VTVEVSRNAITKETIRGFIMRSQERIIHTNFIVGFVFILASADDLHRVNLFGMNVI